MVVPIVLEPESVSVPEPCFVKLGVLITPVYVVLSAPTETVQAASQARPPAPVNVVPAFATIEPADRLKDPVRVITDVAFKVRVVEYESL